MVGLDELGEHAVQGPGVDEGDQMPAEPDPGCSVDQFAAVSLDLGEGRRDVGDLVGHVVQTGSATLQEARDPPGRVGRLDQLDPRIACGHRGSLDALLGEELPYDQAQAERRLVLCDRGVEVGHDDPDMMDSAEGHGEAVYAPRGRSNQGMRTRTAGLPPRSMDGIGPSRRAESAMGPQSKPAAVSSSARKSEAQT